MNAAISSTPTIHDLEIHAISATEWRVFDRRFPPDDALGLLGFVEFKDGVYESLQLSHGFEWFSFSSLDEAAQHFVDVLRRHYPSSEHALAWMPAPKPSKAL